MKKYILGVCVWVTALFIAYPLHAQTNIHNLSLDEAIRYAKESSPKQRISEMQLEQAKLKLQQSRISRIPDIYVSSDVRRNLIIPSTPVPASAFNPNAPEGEQIYMKFNTDWNSSAGINLSYELFNPAKVGLINEQKQQLKITEYDNQLSLKNLQSDVKMAYAECVIAQHQLQSLTADTVYYAASLENSKDLYNKQKISLVEKNSAQTAFNQSLSRYMQGEKIRNDAASNLLYLMGLPVTMENIENLHLSEDIASLYESMLDSEDVSTNSAAVEELRQQEVVSLAENQVKFAKWKYVPSFSLNGFYGANYYSNELNLTKKDNWKGNSFIALTMKLPLTQSLSTSNEVSQLRMNQQIQSENLRDIQNTRNRALFNQENLLQNRKREYVLSEENMKISEQNLRAVEAQLSKGYALEKDVLNARLNVENARHNFMQAAYDIFQSLVAIEKLK